MGIIRLLLVPLAVTAGLITIPLICVAGFPSISELTDPYSYPRMVAWQKLGWALTFCTPALPLLGILPCVSRKVNLMILLTTVALLSSVLLLIVFVHAMLMG